MIKDKLENEAKEFCPSYLKLIDTLVKKESVDQEDYLMETLQLKSMKSVVTIIKTYEISKINRAMMESDPLYQQHKSQFFEDKCKLIEKVSKSVFEKHLTPEMKKLLKTFFRDSFGVELEDLGAKQLSDFIKTLKQFVLNDQSVQKMANKVMKSQAPKLLQFAKTQGFIRHDATLETLSEKSQIYEPKNKRQRLFAKN